MKIIKFLFIVLISFLLISCKKTEEEPIIIPIENIELSYENEGIQVVLNSIDDQLINKKIICYGIILKAFDEQNVDLTKENATQNLTKENNNETEFAFIISNVDKDLYNQQLQIRPYVVYESNQQEEILYSKEYSLFNCYEQAQRTIDTYFSRMIIAEVEGKIITEIKVDADLQKYTISSINQGYSSTLITDYNFITITVEKSEQYMFSDNCVFILNNVEIEPNKFLLNELKLVYKIDDPNWTNPY